MLCPNCKKEMLDFFPCPYCNYGRADPDPELIKPEPRSKMITFNLTEQEYHKILDKFTTVERFRKEIIADNCS